MSEPSIEEMIDRMVGEGVKLEIDRWSLFESIVTASVADSEDVEDAEYQSIDRDWRDGIRSHYASFLIALSETRS